jgi:hypothetical protein
MCTVHVHQMCMCLACVHVHVHICFKAPSRNRERGPRPGGQAACCSCAVVLCMLTAVPCPFESSQRVLLRPESFGNCFLVYFKRLILNPKRVCDAFTNAIGESYGDSIPSRLKQWLAHPSLLPLSPPHPTSRHLLHPSAGREPAPFPHPSTHLSSHHAAESRRKRLVVFEVGLELGEQLRPLCGDQLRDALPDGRHEKGDKAHLALVDVDRLAVAIH